MTPLCPRFVLVLALTVLAVVSYTEACPAGSRQWGVQCLFVEDQDLRTWEGAREACRELGGNLFTPPGLKSLQMLLLNQYGVGQRFWVGASDRKKEGTWLWESDEPVDREDWTWNQPNDCCGGEDCAILGTEWNAPLNDNSCDNRRAYVCLLRESDVMYY